MILYTKLVGPIPMLMIKENLFKDRKTDLVKRGKM